MPFCLPQRTALWKLIIDKSNFKLQETKIVSAVNCKMYCRYSINIVLDRNMLQAIPKCISKN